MYRLGLIDDEQSQQNAFHQTFKDDFEIYIIPLNQDSTEDDLIRDGIDNHIDLLVVDYQMDHFLRFNGDSIARRLDELNPYFPKILLTSHENDALDFIDDANIVNSKDIWSGDSPSDLDIFKKKLIRIINSYNSAIDEAEEALEELEKKRIATGLDPDEEQRYVDKNTFLNKVFGQGKYLSGTFYSVETNRKLDSLIEKTEQLLNKFDEK